MRSERIGLLGRIMFSAALAVSSAMLASGQDLDDIKASGVLRHLSIPYANFNSGAGDGMDVELMQLFAKHLGVKYVYVGSTWGDIIGDLTGKRVKPVDNDIEVLGDAEIKGDVIANGATVLAWREKAFDFSNPTFPTQVWLVSPAGMDLKPITPAGTLNEDIVATRKLLKGTCVMGKSGTCLDLSLYDMAGDGAMGTNFNGSLNDLVPALLKGESELLILDVPDALVALNKWPGQIKILGPMSEKQNMASGFRKTSPKLRAAFNAFLAQSKQDGTYLRLVRKYYPDVFEYFSAFFADCK
jgi:ABC-type amino acid transport substrate-binding protein